MGWFGDLRGGARLLVEFRGLRRAAERIADALELQAGAAPREGQTFRGFSRERTPSDGANSSVTYVDGREAERAFQIEGELTALLGRSPTSEELERGLLGDIE